MLPYQSTLKHVSQQLRREMTVAERMLWSRLRGKQLLGTLFYRQKPIGNYIVDFYCPAAHVVVEVDGGQHFEPENITKDTKRTAYFHVLKLTVLRFDNRQVLTQLEDVVAEVYRVIADKIPPSPPFSKGGETR